MLFSVKKCPKCGETKPVCEFSKNRNSTDRLQYMCKACNKAYNATYHAEHKAEKAAYRAAHSDEITAREAAYYLENKERIVARCTAYNSKNKEKVAARKALWDTKNRERIAARRVARREANPEKVAASQAAWQKANPEKCAANRQRRRTRQANNPVEDFDVMEIWERDNHTCVYCGAPGEAIDHIVPVAEGGGWARDNLCVTCRSCNTSKGAKALIVWLTRRRRLDLLEQGILL